MAVGRMQSMIAETLPSESGAKVPAAATQDARQMPRAFRNAH
jgi:hypothetical protein